MKRFATVMMALLFVGVFARPAAAQVDVGLLGGASFATIEGDEVGEDVGYRTGLNIGALAQFPVTDLISIQPELHYVQKGAELEDEATAVTESLKLDYIELPVLLRVNVPTESRINFGFLLGPEVAYQINCETEIETDAETESAECAETENFEEFDYGLIFGASLGYGMPWGELFLDGRFDLGLNSIFGEGDGDAKNRVYSVLVGFTVPLGM